MNTEDVLEEFRASGALREGHFVLSSGLHSGTFLQKNLVFQYPERTARLCKALAEKIKEAVGKAVGDAKLETQGKADKIEGKVQNAVGGLKDTLRGK